MASKLWRTPKDQLLGQPLSSLASDLVPLAVNVCQEPHRIHTGEFPLPENRIGRAVATAIPLQGATGVLLLVEDISVSKAMDQLKTDFMTSVSHELRTPLTSVLGFTKVVRKKLEETLLPKLTEDHDPKSRKTISQVRENLLVVQQESQRLTEIVNTVLDLMNLESGQVVWRQEPVAIADVLAAALTESQPLFAAKELSATLNIDPHLPKITGDPNRLQQMCWHILTNAAKFTEHGGLVCTASLAQDGERAKVLLQFQDTGIGIAAADQSLIFEKFRQLGDVLTSKPKGLGLGLPIALAIVKHHGGELWVDSCPGQGSTFFVSLPIRCPETDLATAL
jgi:signal transduction histidine kinase